jgi:hypothetical protein
MSNSYEVIYTVGDIAAELGIDRPSQVRRMIEDGRVPFITKIGGSWMLDERSRKFLLKWHPKRRTGLAGQIVSAKMRRAAIKLDPECDVRFREWRQTHPKGWVFGKKAAAAKPVKRRPAKRSTKAKRR